MISNAAYDLAFFFEFFHSSNSLLFSHHCRIHPSNDWAQAALHPPAINASVSFNLWSWSSNAIRCCTSLHMDTRVRFVNHGRNDLHARGDVFSRLGHYIRNTLRRCAGDKMFISATEVVVLNDPWERLENGTCTNIIMRYRFSNCLFSFISGEW